MALDLEEINAEEMTLLSRTLCDCGCGNILPIGSKAIRCSDKKYEGTYGINCFEKYCFSKDLFD